jgi:hypothetical protein
VRGWKRALWAPGAPFASTCSTDWASLMPGFLRILIDRHTPRTLAERLPRFARHYYARWLLCASLAHRLPQLLRAARAALCSANAGARGLQPSRAYAPVSHGPGHATAVRGLRRGALARLGGGAWWRGEQRAVHMPIRQVCPSVQTKAARRGEGWQCMPSRPRPLDRPCAGSVPTAPWPGTLPPWWAVSRAAAPGDVR